MKVSHIFMIGAVSGVWASIAIAMDSGGDESTQITINTSTQSPKSAHRLSQLFRRSSIGSSTGSESEFGGKQAGNQSVTASPASSAGEFHVAENTSPSLMKRLKAKLKSSRRHTGPSTQNTFNDEILVIPSISAENPFYTPLQAALEAAACIVQGAPEVFGNEAYLSSSQGSKQESEIDTTIALLEHLREMLSLYQYRMVPKFEADYLESFNDNFAHVGGFDPHAVYPVFFDCTIEEGVKETHEYFRKKMQEREGRILVLRDLPFSAWDQNEKNLLRQMDWIFRNSESKQYFDAYIQGGEEALAKLCITSKKEAEYYKGLVDKTTAYKSVLDEYRDELKKKAASHHMHTTHNELAKIE